MVDNTYNKYNKYPPLKTDTINLHNRKYEYQIYAKPPPKDDTKKVELVNF